MKSESVCVEGRTESAWNEWIHCVNREPPGLLGRRDAVELEAHNGFVFGRVRGLGVSCPDGDVHVDWHGVLGCNVLDHGQELSPGGDGGELGGRAVRVAEHGVAYVPRELVGVCARGWEMVVDDEIDVAVFRHPCLDHVDEGASNRVCVDVGGYGLKCVAVGARSGARSVAEGTGGAGGADGAHGGRSSGGRHGCDLELELEVGSRELRKWTMGCDEKRERESTCVE
jgi:hypothetical protein